MSQLLYTFGGCVRVPDRFCLVAIIASMVLMTGSAAAADGGESTSTGESGVEDEDDETLTVRTRDRVDIWREDERFPSGATTRIGTDESVLRAETISDALSRVTGTRVRRQSSYGQPAQLSVRGSNPRQIVVDFDGLRLSAPAGTGFDVGTMMTHGIDSVDILRGAAAAPRGSGAIAGALQLNPKRAPDDGLELRGRAVGGSFGTASTEADVGVGNGSFGLHLSGGTRRSEGDFSFVDHRGQKRQRINNDHWRTGIAATGRLQDDDHTLRLTSRFEHGEAGSPGPSEFQQAFSEAGTEDSRFLATLRWEGRALWSNASALVDAYATAGFHDRRSNYENESSFLSGESFENRSRQRTAAATAGVNAFVGDRHLVRLDVEGRVERFEGHTQRSDQRDELRARRHTLAVSATDEWLLADERLSLIASLRSEFSGDEGAVESGPLLPALGAIARIHRRVEIRANAARTHRRPHFDELYLDTEVVRGSPELDDEQAWVADAGIHLGADGDRLRVAATAFEHRMDSTILFLPASAHHFEARNLDEATSRGVETSARVQWTDRWSLDADYTYTRARLAGTDDASPQLPGQPRHRLHARSGMQWIESDSDSRRPALTLRPAVQYRSRINLDNFGNLQNGAALKIDIGADIEWSSRFRTTATAHNLFDHRQSVDSLHRPLPGRAFYLSMEINGVSDTP